MKVCLNNSRSNGFTILEVVMGLAVITMIFGGIFAIAGGSMDLSQRSSRLREAEIRTTQFGQVVRNAFLQLSPRSRVEVKGDTLRIYDSGRCLQWPGVPAGISETQVRFDDGSISVFHYLGDVEAANLALMDNITSISWEVFDPISGQWVGAWIDEPENRASLLRLRYTEKESEGFNEEVFRIPTFSLSEFKPPTPVNENANTR